jgi:hypothetical protein
MEEIHITEACVWQWKMDRGQVLGASCTGNTFSILKISKYKEVKEKAKSLKENCI